MKKRLTLLAITLFGVITLTLAPLSLAGAQSIADNVCKGILTTETGTVNKNATAASCQETGDKTLSGVIQRVVNMFSIVVGAVSVIMIIIGGFRYIISGGDSTAVTAAKNTILYAIVGLVIVLFAQVIVRFVITNITQASG
ncbi:hypothetical protein KC973_02830 [Candidatus Saccharibacteria bacterium]|nr:hypothetical protein [Candidatus Saccharibacteria bacterium]